MVAILKKGKKKTTRTSKLKNKAALFVKWIDCFDDCSIKLQESIFTGK